MAKFLAAMGTGKVWMLCAIIVLSTCCFPLLASGQNITHPSEVSALKAVRGRLKDPMKNLRGWQKTDPCSSNWTGVFCINDLSDGYLHVQELRLLNMNLSGRLAPELGQLSNLTILNFLWNNISGSVPKEIGNLSNLKYMLLSGNQLSGLLPDELGNLSKLLIFQIDDNYISGSLPKSLANLTSLKHFHMNNNSISGQIPPEISLLPNLLHFLMDNNNLSGYLPPELSQMPSLKILQLDRNNFGGTEIPASYGNMPKLLKLSLRYCNLQGPVPDLSGAPFLYYLDLSFNQLSGNIPTNRLSGNVTTIALSDNMLNGTIPSNFTGLPRLQRLSLQNNMLGGDVPSIWENRNFSADAKLTLDFRNNSLTNTSSILNPPSNVTIKLQGNPVCDKANELNIANFCGLSFVDKPEAPETPSNNSTDGCKSQSCPATNNFHYVLDSPVSCFCAAPIGLGIRLRSPSVSDFRPYQVLYKQYITSSLSIQLYQLSIDSFQWQEGPRLLLELKIFPQSSYSTNSFNSTELHRLIDFIATFSIPSNDVFGPYEIIGFSLLGPYNDVILEPYKSGMSKGVMAGIILAAISCFLVLVSVVAVIVISRKKKGKTSKMSGKQQTPKSPINAGSVKGYNFEELKAATGSFRDDCEIGRGGYGKVYKGILPDGTVVAIKRAEQGSLQGQKEFYTEIELLSRLHHRNLVSLLGYCDEEDEQMLVYEFMPNGSIVDLLSARFKQQVSFAMRLRIALGSARGILYLHTEADPPIIHRDIKPNNILLDAKFTPKVSDFGISKLVPTPEGDAKRSHVTTIVKGTPGYVDPEYFLTYRLTEKSDVYSLGVVFLELATGMQPIFHGRNIVREVDAACQSGMMLSIIDRSMGQYSEEPVKRFMYLALRCCHDEAVARPFMLEIVRELENIHGSLTESEKKGTLSPISPTASISGMSSGFYTSSVNSQRNSHIFTAFAGSELVSGAIPSIRPR